MSLTIIGFFFVPATIIFTLFWPDYLLPLLMISSVFQASSVGNGRFGGLEFGLSPFYVVAIGVGFRYLILRLDATPRNVKGPVKKIVEPLKAFWLWSVTSAFILPKLFDGIAVYSPRAGIDEQFIDQTPLHFGASNLAQVVYLTLDIMIVFFGLRVIKTERQVARLLKSFYVAICAVTLIGFWQYLASIRQWWFPFDVFGSNPAEIQAFTDVTGSWQRMTSTFSEPSYAGAFLSAACAGMIATFTKAKRHILLYFVAIFAVFLALLDTASTTGYVAVAITIGLLFLYTRRQEQRTFFWSDAKGWIAIAALGLLAASILFANSDLLQAAGTNTVYKTEGLSFVHRVAADAFALELIVRTWGLGTGLGSNRPSSLITALLSTVGVPGTLFFIAVFFRIFKIRPLHSGNVGHQLTYWSLAGLLAAQALAVPDLSFSVLWALIMLISVQLNVLFQNQSRMSNAAQPAEARTTSKIGGTNARNCNKPE